jgi:hypothetical protein
VVMGSAVVLHERAGVNERPPQAGGDPNADWRLTWL